MLCVISNKKEEENTGSVVRSLSWTVAMITWLFIFVNAFSKYFSLQCILCTVFRETNSNEMIIYVRKVRSGMGSEQSADCKSVSKLLNNFHYNDDF